MISVVAYLGLSDLLVGVGVLLWPRLLRLTRRRSALPFFATGLLLATVGAWWPHRLRPTTAGTLLASSLPEAQFSELHSTVIRAAPDDVWRAIHGATANEIRLFRLLTWMRSPRIPGTSSAESILAPDWHAPSWTWR